MKKSICRWLNWKCTIYQKEKSYEIRVLKAYMQEMKMRGQGLMKVLLLLRLRLLLLRLRLLLMMEKTLLLLLIELLLLLLLLKLRWLRLWLKWLLLLLLVVEKLLLLLLLMEIERVLIRLCRVCIVGWDHSPASSSVMIHFALSLSLSVNSLNDVLGTRRRRSIVVQ